NRYNLFKVYTFFKENEKAINSFTTKTLILEAVMIGVVVGIKINQPNVSFKLITIATAFVTLLLCWHFWNFFPRRSLYEKTSKIVLQGLELERGKPISEINFFRAYIEKFSVLGQIVEMAILDLLLIYFFSVSLTQLLTAINSEAVMKLMPISIFTSPLILLGVGFAHYQPIQPLALLKKSIQKI
ncbi:MAG TPA: hypothetical protein PKW79_05590, partial [Rhabdochlamydiaceae bacterium]|nr:hypothetical protein [Rhabdochlamydiaceae bacterium]